MKPSSVTRDKRFGCRRSNCLDGAESKGVRWPPTMNLGTFLYQSVLKLRVFLLPLQFNRLAYLQLYEDEPADEFTETMQCSPDGSSYVDDPYFAWMQRRFEFRSGAEAFDGQLAKLVLEPDEMERVLQDLQDHKSLSRPLALEQVIADEYARWREDPEFPDEAAIAEMGIDSLIVEGEGWVDGASSQLSSISGYTSHPSYTDMDDVGAVEGMGAGEISQQ